jgi:ABC-type Na+ transport system ATPase subunit NatA
MDLMRVDGLTKRYDDLAALAEISFVVEEGEILCTRCISDGE